MTDWRQILERARPSLGWLPSARVRWSSVAAAASILFVLFLVWDNLTDQRGEIIVSSPQVYTRERLVNDRYDQAHWLQEQLQKLDDSDRLITGTSSRSQEISLNAGLNASAPSASPSPAPGSGSPSQTAAKPEAQGALPFDLEFVIRASIRDTIRELALENSLDDRHDLRGTSIYGLKFDTTVIPGSSRDSARVQVVLQLGDLGNIANYVRRPDAPGKDDSGLPPYIAEYYIEQSQRKLGKFDDKKPLRVDGLDRIYRSWVKDVGQRLNQYTEKAASTNACSCDASPSRCPSPRQLAEQALAAVLGERIALVNVTSASQTTATGGQFTTSWPVPLRYPLNKVLQAVVIVEPSQAMAGKGCGEAVKFETNAVIDFIYSIPSPPGDPIPPGYFTGNKLFDVGIPEESLYLQVADATLTPSDSTNGAQISRISKFARDNQLFRSADTFLLPIPADKEKGIAEKPVRGQYLLIPTGLFTFIERAADQDQFAYALSPRSELAGYLVDNLSSTAASVQAAEGGGQAGGSIRVAQAQRKASATPRSFGFVQASNDAIEFGWQVDTELGAPSQKSHLALVSVPAWLNEITLCIRTGWKTTGWDAALRLFAPATRKSGCDQTLQVPVPQDMEALDAIVINGQERPPPRIFNQLMDKNPLMACAPASIVIPGERLWRNTVVTLGGQRASRIAVLPNMRGIVAEFENIASSSEAPLKPGQTSQDARWLRVWTSEGSDVVVAPISITPPANADTCRPAAPVALAH